MNEKNQTKKVISAGHICLDITPDFTCDAETGKTAKEMFIPGRLLKVGKAQISPGGSVINTGIGIGLMGGTVELMGSIGKDEFGRMILDYMKQYGVHTESVRQSGNDETSYSIILTPPGTDRIIFHYEGTNADFNLEDTDIPKVRDAALFHFGYPPLMRSMYQDTGKKFVELLHAVQEAGTAVSVDMAMFEEESDAGREDWDTLLMRSLPMIDFFMPSAEELCMMLDREQYHEWMRRADGRDITEILDISRDIKPLADKLIKYGAGAVLIKCGVKGLYFRSACKERLSRIKGNIGAEIAESWADKEWFEESYLAEKIVSGTGAGDTAIAGFITALLAGETWEDCLHIAAAAGALCVGTYDALSGLISLSEIKEKINAGWKKISEKE